MYKELLEVDKEKYPYHCKECGSFMLNEDNSRRLLKGSRLRKEGCVVYPKTILGKEYNRVRCYDCFEKKYNRKPNRLNMVGRDFIYLFDIDEGIIEEAISSRAVTLKNLIKRHGEKEGQRKWDEYRNKQSLVNTFEYKKEKYGWTKKQFDEFNKSRAVTLENCIKRHGDTKGTKLFNDYCETQKYVGCAKEYFVEKYGQEDGCKKYKQLNEKKKITRKNMVRKYGNIIGNEKYDSFIESQRNKEIPCFSKPSQDLCRELHSKLGNLNVFYYTHNKEYPFEVDDSLFFVDFYVLEKNCIIEFLGDYWHCNPTKYEKEFFLERRNMTASEIWEYDKNRNSSIERKYGARILNVWESEYNNNKEETIKKCLEFINGI